jgi:hypothetical protein
LASLVANANGLLFNDLKQLGSLTDGNLSRHAQKVDAGSDANRATTGAASISSGCAAALRVAD